MTQKVIYPSTRTNEGLHVLFEGVRGVLVSGNKEGFQNIVDAWYEACDEGTKESWDKLEVMMDRANAVRTWAKDSRFDVSEGVIRWNGQEVYNTIAQRILRAMDEGEGALSFEKFYENLERNPSMRARSCLERFLEASNLPITPSGCFLGYKVITRDWRDVYTRKFDNSIGAVVAMPRHLVNDDPNITCAEGLHVCSESYAPHYGGWSSDRRLVVVEVNPADVVCVPTDYNDAKMRVCKYKVVGEVSRQEVEGRILDQSAVNRNYYDPEECEEYKTREVRGILYDDGTYEIDED